MARLTVSTRELSRRSGLPVRQVHTFADAGVLIPDEGTEAPGRGGSRQFPVAEEEVAILLSAVVHKGMSVPEARNIAATLRPMVRAPDELGFKGLEQARELGRYVSSCLALPVLEGLKPRWGHVEPTDNNLRKIQAWIALELAKQGAADPIIFLYRGPDDTWGYTFWVVLTGPCDGPHRYRFGNRSIDVRVTRPSGTRDDPDYDLLFEDILIELGARDCLNRENPRGGYVIMPRRVYGNPFKISN